MVVGTTDRHVHGGSDRVRACRERDGLAGILSAHSAGVIDDNSTDDIAALFYNSHSGIHFKASACEQHCNHLPGGPNKLSMFGCARQRSASEAQHRVSSPPLPP